MTAIMMVRWSIGTVPTIAMSIAARHRLPTGDTTVATDMTTARSMGRAVTLTVPAGAKSVATIGAGTTTAVTVVIAAVIAVTAAGTSHGRST